MWQTDLRKELMRDVTHLVYSFLNRGWEIQDCSDSFAIDDIFLFICCHIFILKPQKVVLLFWFHVQ